MAAMTTPVRSSGRHRVHHVVGGKAISRAHWFQGEYRADVDLPAGPQPGWTTWPTLEEAWTKAEESIQAFFPHDCAEAGCEPVAEYGN